MNKSCVVSAFFAVMVLLMGASSQTVRADDASAANELMPKLGGLPTDFGPATIASAKRAVQAKMTDWQDDQKQLKTVRITSCVMAGIEGGILLGLDPMPTDSLMTLLPDLFRDPAEGPAQPLLAPLSDLVQSPQLTDDERATLNRLMSTVVSDRSDQIRLLIDTEWFLMGVTDRLYDQLVTYHFDRTTGFAGFFRADFEYCQGFSLANQRDQALIDAGNRMLSFYDDLLREIQD